MGDELGVEFVGCNKGNELGVELIGVITGIG